MIRRRQVHPREDGYVAFEDLEQVVRQVLLVQEFAGGVVSILTDRDPTGLPGEMVTTNAVVEWRDRTDARPSPEIAKQTLVWAQEQAAAPREPQNLEAQALANLVTEPATFGVEVDEAEALARAEVAEDIDYSALAEEDVDEPVPAAH